MPEHKQRSVGLSKHRGPGVSLLKNFRHTSAPIAEKGEMGDSEDINRLPEPGTDSDDSDSARHAQRNRDFTGAKLVKPPNDRGTAEANPPRADRRNLNTSSVKSVKPNPRPSPARHGPNGLRRGSKVATNVNRAGACSGNEAPPSSAGSKRSADEAIEGNHLKDSFGFPKRQRSVGYGKGAHKSTQASASRSSAVHVRVPRRTFKNLATSPQKLAASRATFRTNPSSPSPPGSPAKASLRKPDQGVPPKRPKFKVNLPDSDEDVPSDSKDKAIARRGKQFTIGTAKGDCDVITRDTSLPEASEDLPRKPVLIVPDLGDLGPLVNEHRDILSTQQLGFMDEGQGSNDLHSEPSLDDDLADRLTRKGATANARCPMCLDMVDPELLKKHSVGTRMSIKKQSAFCRLHKRREAQEARREKGYPDIEWAALEARFAQHKRFIQDILEGQEQSHFASILGEKVESGQNRTLLKTDESLTPGYYGPRGLRTMTDLIMGTFSDTVRKRAVEDPLVSARGYTGYVQVVLVPELTVRLIMEDMSVDEQAARRIMRESSDLGEFLYEEVRDVVQDSDSDREN